MILILKKARNPRAKKLLKAYNQSAATMNLLRAFSRGGMADLNRSFMEFRLCKR